MSELSKLEEIAAMLAAGAMAAKGVPDITYCVTKAQLIIDACAEHEEAQLAAEIEEMTGESELDTEKPTQELLDAASAAMDLSTPQSYLEDRITALLEKRSFCFKGLSQNLPDDENAISSALRGLIDAGVVETNFNSMDQVYLYVLK